MPTNNKNSENNTSNYTTFETEFFAYNISITETVKKEYIFAKHNKESQTGTIYKTLDSPQLHMFLNALENQALKKIQTEGRYSLFDISFRECSKKNCIGFSLNDYYDYNYITPEQIFAPFKWARMESFIKTIKEVQNCIFKEEPHYNPIFMIGLVFDDNTLKSIKAYIRYDLDEQPKLIDRVNLVTTISKTINSAYSSDFISIVERLESLNFKFSFIGIDSYLDEKRKFKLYFRAFDETAQSATFSELSFLFPWSDKAVDIQHIFAHHENGIWGVAISTDSFEYVNGVQLYFYP